MTLGDRIVRLRTAIDSRFALFSVVLLALALVGGGLVYTAYAAPDTEIEEETYEAWATTYGFDHSADVLVQNMVFDVGDELHNQELYFTRITPELSGEFQYEYTAPEGDVRVTIDLDHVIRAVSDDGTVHWEVSEPLNRTTAEQLEPGDRTAASFAVDVPSTMNETELIERSVGEAPGDVETLVVADVTVDGTIAGEQVFTSERHELELDPDDDTYAVDGPANERDGVERTTEVETETDQSLWSPLLGATLVVVSAGSFTVGALAKRRGQLAPDSETVIRIQLRNQREQFDDWITRGTIPDEVAARSRIEIDDLEGLVDVAIDCDSRVIEDTAGSGVTYYVPAEGLLYVYEPSEGIVLEPHLEGETRYSDADPLAEAAADDAAEEPVDDD